MTRRYWVETLGCPKNQVDSDKLVGTLAADGLEAAGDPATADLIVVNTCAFIEEARQESIDTVLELTGAKKRGADVVVTGCMAERYGSELAEALPEVAAVRGFGVPVTLTAKPTTTGPPLDLSPSMDLLELPRPAASAPWAYVKIAEGCDRRCGFCAIPSFRGPQRSRSRQAILDEVDQLGAAEIVLVAQDLASYGRDQGVGTKDLIGLVGALRERVEWIRLLYLYPSELTDALVEAILSTGVPYFDLSLQHVSVPLVRRMRRWGNGEKYLERISAIRSLEPDAAFRSNFIVGYPGETEDDHDQLLEFVNEAQLDWCGFFAYSAEDGTYATGLDGVVAEELVRDRLAELTELQDGVTARKRDEMVGREVEVLVDRRAVARSVKEAPEIDGVIAVPDSLAPGTFATVTITSALGPDLEALS